MIDGYNRALATAKENEALARRIKEAGGDPKALDDVKTASIVETSMAETMRHSRTK